MGREELEALEETLRNNPDDAVVWQVYADWLQDRDDVRGKLVRLERQADDGTLSPDERQEARQEIDWIVADHQRSWLMGWAPRVEAELSWRHGFLFGVRFPEPDALAGFEALLAVPSARLLTEVSFAQLLPEELPELVRVLAGSTVRSLRLEEGPSALGDEGAALLASARSLGPLKRLALLHQGLGSAGVLELTRSLALRPLVALNLSGSAPGHQGAVALRALASLTTLSLSRCQLEAPALLEALAAALPAGLRSLDLSMNGISDEGLSVLLRSGVLSRLHHLALGGNPLTDGGAQALARSGVMRSLQSLVLSETAIGDEGALALAQALPEGSPLTLNLSNLPLGDEGYQALYGTEAYARGQLRLYGGWE